ncbi:MAG: Ig-like domain-containing protein [Gemmatimonadota bacterium]
MLLAIVASLILQVPAQDVPQAVRLDVMPAEARVQVGQTLKLSAKAFDAAGRELPNARIFYFSGANEGDVDSTGVVTAGYAGQVKITVITPKAGGGQVTAFATVRVLPAPPARITLDPLPTRAVVGTRFTVTGTAFSRQNDVRYDKVSFRSTNPAVLTVSGDGLVRAAAPGRAAIIATSGGARAEHTVQVVSGAGVRLTLAPGSSAARTGDVLRFVATLKDAAGKPITDAAVAWSTRSAAGSAMIGNDGHFVAELPGHYTVTASAAGQEADAIVDVTPREVGRGFQLLGRVPISFSTAEVWVHPNGTCVYLSTIADRVYAIDVTTPTAPRIVDSMVTNARIVNDVMTTEDGAIGVFSREGASDRQNGIVVFDASDACHPKPIAVYTATLSGGAHSAYVAKGHVYVTDDATGSLRVIDIRDPRHPREVGRWEAQQTEAGRYLHDVMVVDGLAYLSYWNDGLIILDVGNGIKGGSPGHPVLVSQFKYDLDRLYARVQQLYGLGARGTHTAWRHGNYVFIGDEVYAERPMEGVKDGNNLTFGRLQVLDVTNIEQPKLVAWYEPTDGGVHNIWVEGDTLYLGNYQGGARALDISGELKGDLLRQGREISWLLTADSLGFRPRATFAWGAVVKNGIIFVPDINTGLWIMKLAPPRPHAVP